jgi:hypothetical protein
MMRPLWLHALSVAVVVLLPAGGEGQMVRGAARPPRTSGDLRAPTIRREPSQPPVVMGSPRQSNGPVIVRDDYFGRRYGFGRPFSSCYFSSFCRGYAPYAPYVVVRNTSYSHVHVHSTYVGWPWYVSAYAAPVYTTFWAPGPARIWSATSPGAQASATPADLTNVRPLTVIASADSGGVMRVETVSDSVARVTWLGTARPIREARLFLADSIQQSLRGALVDQDTRSALLSFSELAQRVAYVGLTITYASGAIETTLIPYSPRRAR